MVMVKFIVISLMLFSASLTLLLTGFSIVKLRKPGYRSFIMLMFCISIYCIGYILELTSLSLEEVKRAIIIQYLGIPLIPVCWLSFAITYTGIIELKKWHYSLYVIPLLTIVLILTNQFHHLFYENLSITFFHNLTITKVSPGVWYRVNMGYGYLLILSGIIFYIKRIMQSNGIIRTQSALTLISGIIPWTGNIIYMAGFSYMGLDYTPFFLSAGIKCLICLRLPPGKYLKK